MGLVVEARRLAKVFPLLKENCCLCRTPTSHWYTAKDVALCEPCASTATDADIPSKTEWFEKERALRPRWALAGMAAPLLFPSSPCRPSGIRDCRRGDPGDDRAMTER